MPERDWNRDWDLAIDPSVPDTEKYDKLQLALRHWLYEYKQLEAKWLAEAEEKIRLRYDKTQLEERIRELEEENKKLKEQIEELTDYETDWIKGVCRGYY
jgi:predicted nuclease with TOPRIM domain